MSINYTLLSLLEASRAKSNGGNAEDDETDAAGAEDTNATDANTDDAATDQDTDTGDDTTDDNPDDNADDQNNEEENNDEENQDDTQQEDDSAAEDDFSMDAGEEEDNEPNPDGLVDPDDDGSGDVEEDTEEETNVQTNVLNLSKLDRVLAKRAVLNDFMSLRTSCTTVLNIISRNESILDAETREMIEGDINKLYTRISDYLQYKFGINNYEENLHNYMLFVKRLTEIINDLQNSGVTKV